MKAKLTRIFAALLCLFACLAWSSGIQAAVVLSPEEKKIAAEETRRESLLVQAAQNAYTPPAPGSIPHPDEIPLSGAWEDLEWDTPLMQSIYRNPYSYGNNLENYQPCLREALGGNPKAMLALSMYCYLWGYVLEDSYPDFPAEVHRPEYWREWAGRLTNPGWVNLRLGDLHGRWPVTSLEYYRQAAELGNPEAMYNYYKLTGKSRYYLLRSAALGNAKAAFLVSEELEKLGGQENLQLARSYTWLSALNADEWGLLHSSFAFYNRDFTGSFNSCEQGYLYALLNLRYQYGTSFSTQRPDNICMLSPEVISRLEASADRWQADYDQRRLPHLMRARFKRAGEIEALQDELGPLLSKQGVMKLGRGENIAYTGSTQGRTASASGSTPVGWHLGFYSENERPARQGDANLSAYLLPTSREYYARYIPWVYAFVAFTMLSGAGLIFYGQRLKQKRLSKYRSQNGTA